jgi:F0F1-type ATP synthase membrane subunit a
MKHLFSHFNPPATSAIELTSSSVSNVDVINSIAPTTLPDTSFSSHPFSTLKEKSSSLLWQHLSNGWLTSQTISLAGEYGCPELFLNLGWYIWFALCLVFYFFVVYLVVGLVLPNPNKSHTTLLPQFTKRGYRLLANHWVQVHGGQPFVEQHTTPKGVFATKSEHQMGENCAVLFVFLATMNLGGMLYGTYALTTNPIFTLTVSTSIWLGSFAALCKNYINFNMEAHNKHDEIKPLVKNLMEARSLVAARFFPVGTPLWLAILICPVELLSLFIRPLSMGIRIFANLVAGHVIMGIITIALVNVVATCAAISLGWLMTIHGALGLFISIIAFVILFGFECAVAIVQAYVLTLLASTFFKESTELY